MIILRRIVGSLLLSLPMICAAVTLSAQTTVTLKDETEHVGTIVRESADTIVIRTEAGIEIALPRSSVRAIDYGSERSDWSHGYWGVGGVFGSPGGINLVLERNFGGPIGLRASAGYSFITAGVELDGLLRFARKGTSDHHIVLGAGYIHGEGFYVSDPDETTKYLHFGYLMNVGGFNLMVSLGHTIDDEDDDDRFTSFFQIGYVHRFE